MVRFLTIKDKRGFLHKSSFRQNGFLVFGVTKNFMIMKMY